MPWADRFVGRWQQLSKRYGEAQPTDQDLERAARETFDRIERTKDKPGRSRGRPSYPVLEANDNIPRDRNRFWSGDMLICNNESEALRMVARNANVGDFKHVKASQLSYDFADSN